MNYALSPYMYSSSSVSLPYFHDSSAHDFGAVSLSQFSDVALDGSWEAALIEPDDSKQSEEVKNNSPQSLPIPPLTSGITSPEGSDNNGNETNSIQATTLGTTNGGKEGVNGGTGGIGDDDVVSHQPSASISPKDAPTPSPNNCRNTQGCMLGLKWIRAQKANVVNSNLPFNMKTILMIIKREQAVKLLLESTNEDAMLAIRFLGLMTPMPFGNLRGDEILLIRRRDLLLLLRALDPDDELYDGRGVVYVGHPGIGMSMITLGSEL